MEVKLMKDYIERDLTIPEGHEGERVTWDWMSGRTDFWERDESGGFPDWLGYNILLAKLAEWDRRDAEIGEEALKQAWINIGKNGVMRGKSPIELRKQGSPYIFEITLTEGKRYEKWMDLRQLIDYLIDNEKAVQKRISEERATVSEARRSLDTDILQMRL